jgi:hypothetical protein
MLNETHIIREMFWQKGEDLRASMYIHNTDTYKRIESGITELNSKKMSHYLEIGHYLNGVNTDHKFVDKLFIQRDLSVGLTIKGCSEPLFGRTEGILPENLAKFFTSFNNNYSNKSVICQISFAYKSFDLMYNYLTNTFHLEADLLDPEYGIAFSEIKCKYEANLNKAQDEVSNYTEYMINEAVSNDKNRVLNEYIRVLFNVFNKLNEEIYEMAKKHEILKEFI